MSNRMYIQFLNCAEAANDTKKHIHNPDTSFVGIRIHDSYDSYFEELSDEYVSQLKTYTLNELLVSLAESFSAAFDDAYSIKDGKVELNCISSLEITGLGFNEVIFNSEVNDAI